MLCRAFSFLLALCAAPAFAQPDVVTLASPDGQIRFRLYTTYPDNDLSQYWKLTYDVTYRGKPLIEPSYMLFAIQDQDVLLGEKLGLTALSPVKKVEGRYNTVIAQYLQSGSLGRRLTVEARAYDDGLAFRYYIPRSGPLEDLRIEDEETDFRFAQDGRAYALAGDEYRASRISEWKRDTLLALPLVVEQPGVGWVQITEAQVENYAGMSLFHPEGTILRTTLPPRVDDPYLAVHGETPVELPWRVLLIAAEPRKLLESNIVQDLNPPPAIADTSWIKPPKGFVAITDSTNLEAQFAKLEKSGVTGVKIDLMNRGDQQAIELRSRAVKIAAAHHLMIEFENSPIMDGIERTWPNVMVPANLALQRLLQGL